MLPGHHLIPRPHLGFTSCPTHGCHAAGFRAGSFPAHGCLSVVQKVPQPFLTLTAGVCTVGSWVFPMIRPRLGIVGGGTAVAAVVPMSPLAGLRVMPGFPPVKLTKVFGPQLVNGGLSGKIHRAPALVSSVSIPHGLHFSQIHCE